MTDTTPPYGDALSAPFWSAAEKGELLLQRCAAGHHQLYPRPFCVACSGEVSWVAARGTGTVYSVTRVHQQISEELEAPYLVALVDLDEGPRMLTNILGDECRIGDRVALRWHPREGKPPMPVFAVADPAASP